MCTFSVTVCVLAHLPRNEIINEQKFSLEEIKAKKLAEKMASYEERKKKKEEERQKRKQERDKVFFMSCDFEEYLIITFCSFYANTNKK